ncbi:hypothetical protein BB558_000842 [Smittium angustum]|uniref:B30.2/SPRY domain-containing protein n=1 Tax=Smittium angustum TaxID=133377 RepID=A0A2U1JDB1_SMIAN|nr:hypothetical protein BB558_000842 [Smittium angustum]
MDNNSDTDSNSDEPEFSLFSLVDSDGLPISRSSGPISLPPVASPQNPAPPTNPWASIIPINASDFNQDSIQEFNIYDLSRNPSNSRNSSIPFDSVRLARRMADRINAARSFRQASPIGYSITRNPSRRFTHSINIQDDDESIDDSDSDEDSEMDDDSSSNRDSILEDARHIFGTLTDKSTQNDSESEDDSEFIDLSQKLMLPSYLYNTAFGNLRKKFEPSVYEFLSKNSENLLPHESNQQDQNSIPKQILKTISLSNSTTKYLVPKDSFSQFIKSNPDFKSSLKFPTRFNKKDCNKNVKVLENNLQVDYVGSGAADEDSGMVRSNYPIPKISGVFYFEVTILNKGTNGYIGIGFCIGTAKLNRLPGWDTGSWGYHGDDGNSFLSSGGGKKYGPKYTTGDTIGCGINFITNEAFFVKNGVFLGIAFSNLKFNNSIFACVGMRTQGEKVVANFGQKPFVYDIDSYVHEQRKKMWSSVSSTDITSLIQTSLEKLSTQTESNTVPSLTTVPDYKVLLTPNKQPEFMDVVSEDIPNTNFGENSIAPSTPQMLFSLTQSVDKHMNNKTPSDNDVVNELILSYLVHHGYTKTAKSFSRNVIGICLNPDLDENSEKISLLDNILHQRELQVERRKNICHFIEEGNVYKAINIILKHYPIIMRNNWMLLFNLRCQYFIELARVANSGELPLSDLMPPDSSDTCIDTSNDYIKQENTNKNINSPQFTETENQENNKLNSDTLEETFSSVMDVDDIPPADESSNLGSECKMTEMFTVPTTNSIKMDIPSVLDNFPTVNQIDPKKLTPKEAVKEMMEFGRYLQAYYSKVRSSIVDLKLTWVFSIFAYTDPIHNTDSQSLFDVQRRYEISRQANRDILAAEGKRSSPPLENIYMQIGASLSSLGEDLDSASTSLISLEKKYLY